MLREAELCDGYAYRTEHRWSGVLSIAFADRNTNHGTRCLLRLLKSSKLQSPQRVNYPTGYLWLGYSLPSLAREQRQIKEEHADREEVDCELPWKSLFFFSCVIVRACR